MTPQALLLAWLCVGQGNLFDDADDVPRQGPRTAWAAKSGAHVLVEPDPASAITSTLRRGQEIEVRGEGPPGWLKIAPPGGSFSWVERSAVEDLDNDRARVTARAAAVRPGVEGASLPSGVWTVVRRGDVLALVDHPPLVVRQPDDGRRVWYAVEPPRDEVRYVRSDDVNDSPPRVDGGDPESPFPELNDDADAPAPRSRLAAFRVGPVDADLVTPGNSPDESALPAQFRQALNRVEALHKAALRGPVDTWSLDEIGRQYDSLWAQAAAPAERQAVEVRRARLTRQQSLTRTARELAEVVKRGQALDAEVAGIRSRMGEIASGADTPFEAEGLLQTSSVLVDGQKAFVLIDDQGHTAAYLLMSPGQSASPFVAHRVGVRGDSRFHTVLRQRVIRVQELQRLDQLLPGK